MPPKLKKPKIKTVANKYSFDLLDKNGILNCLNTIKDQLKTVDKNSEQFQELVTDVSVVNVYFNQRYPMELCKNYLGYSHKCPLEDNDLLIKACVKHQYEILVKNQHKKKIKHIIDGMEYHCSIGYAKRICDCGVEGYTWFPPHHVEFKRSYWLQDEFIPLIELRHEPVLTFYEEYKIIQKYIKENGIIKKYNPKWINHKHLIKRISVYPLYYSKYWHWEHSEQWEHSEHMQVESEPISEKEWEEYISTCGCANHRDLIEMVHMYHFKKRRDLRYGYTF